MSKHTPGPWVVDRNHYGTAFGVAPAKGRRHDLDMICDIYKNHHGDTEANTILISAAPDYYAGVELMLANEQCGGDDWWRGWEMVKAAHAKAEGNQTAANNRQTASCCECGEDYPRSELLAGYIYCQNCREPLGVKK